ncbi:MAG: SDR family NAD(P)-dependent oxidoreductase [Bacteroidetes bacterium]|nr:SDR family NAD(P)-dependent oxidoreductase [Bacteroidota bacterium]
MKSRLQNKIVLITGASSGIGAATAKEFANEGAMVLLVARNETKLKIVVTEIIERGGKATYFIADVSNFKVVQQLAEKVKAEIGVPDIIVNNAGQGVWKFIDETAYEEVSEMMAVPYFASFYMTKAFLPEMQKRNSGHIVNMTSYAGFIAFSGATAYIAARTAMIGFHNALAADLYGTKVKTSLAYFAKVKSDYWQNNPGSEERLPTSQSLIPVITTERAALAIVKGVRNGKKKIATPFMIFVMNALIRFMPGLTKLIINKTGYKRN